MQSSADAPARPTQLIQTLEFMEQPATKSARRLVHTGTPRPKGVGQSGRAAPRNYHHLGPHHAARKGSALLSASDVCGEAGGELHRRFDLRAPDRHALDVHPDRHVQAAAELNEFDCCGQRLFQGSRQRVG